MIKFFATFALIAAAGQTAVAPGVVQDVGTWKVTTRVEANQQVVCILDSEAVDGVTLQLSGWQGPIESPGRLALTVPDILSERDRATIRDVQAFIDKRRSWTVDATSIRRPSGSYVVLDVEPSLEALLPFLEKGFNLGMSINGRSYSVDLSGSAHAIAILRNCLEDI